MILFFSILHKCSELQNPLYKFIAGEVWIFSHFTTGLNPEHPQLLSPVFTKHYVEITAYKDFCMQEILPITHNIFPIDVPYIYFNPGLNILSNGLSFFFTPSTHICCEIAPPIWQTSSEHNPDIPRFRKSSYARNRKNRHGNASDHKFLEIDYDYIKKNASNIPIGAERRNKIANNKWFPGYSEDSKLSVEELQKIQDELLYAADLFSEFDPCELENAFFFPYIVFRSDRFGDEGETEGGEDVGSLEDYEAIETEIAKIVDED